MEWREMKEGLAEYFADKRLVRDISPEDILTISPDTKRLFVGPIDWTWGGSDQDIDGKLDGIKTAYAQRCNQVEALMQEAGMLIERSLGDLNRYDELNLERFKLLAEFVEYDRTRTQQLAEQADAEYWNGLSAQADLSYQAKVASFANSAAVQERYAFAVARFAEAVSVAEGEDIARQNASGTLGATTAGQLQYQAQATAGAIDGQGQAVRTKYETRSRVHEAARQLITEGIVGIKLQEMNRHGGALNYNERMLELGRRALDDFLEVHARLYAITLGIREFYSVKDPSEKDLYESLKNSRTRIEGALNWLRKAANALARAKMDEQQCVVRVTIEPKVSGKLLHELLAGVIATFEPDLVTDLRNAHLKGMSATAEGLSGDSWIDLRIISPEQKLTSAAITLPSVAARLGRVSSSASLTIRDIVGVRQITDRSPVGDWQVRAVRHGQGEGVTRLHLDFHLAFGPW